MTVHVGHSPRHERYQLTCAEFDALVLRSEGRCDRCDEPSRRLQIDHDHRLGWRAVRGLLCASCNAFVAIEELPSARTVSTDSYLRQPPFHASIPTKRPAPQLVEIGHELWGELGERVGPDGRSETIRDLVKRYLAGEAMPDLPKKS